MSKLQLVLTDSSLNSHSPFTEKQPHTINDLTKASHRNRGSEWPSKREIQQLKKC